jgi:prepilin-type N-terminal cleavage/methylation domain-containing protein
MIRASRSRISRRPDRGFTLVEVLASLAIVLIVLPVAMEAISLETATASRTRRKLEAANLAASKLAELVATNAWQNGNSSGDFSNYSPSFPDYTWTSTVTQYQEATTGATAAVASASGTTLGGASSSGSTPGSTTTLAVTLQELDVTVTWPGRNTTFSITLSTLIYPGLGSS